MNTTRHPWLGPVLVALIALLTTSSGWAQGDGAQDVGQYKVIVHPSNRTSAISKRDLARIFLKKTSRWPDGRTVRPVDLDAGSKVRQRFTSDILDRTVRGVRSYWYQTIFSGREVPPPELQSDAAVVVYVLRNEGAIGYVSASTPTGRAKVIEVRR